MTTNEERTNKVIRQYPLVFSIVNDCYLKGLAHGKNPPRGDDYDPEHYYQLIEAELNQAREQAGFNALQDFMGFVRNGHNLKPGDLDRIENEYALFQCRYYLQFTDEYLKSLTQKGTV